MENTTKTFKTTMNLDRTADRVPITDDQIVALSAEAAEHGDLDMVATCDRAVDGDSAARAQCEAAIDAARAMADY